MSILKEKTEITVMRAKLLIKVNDINYALYSLYHFNFINLK